MIIGRNFAEKLYSENQEEKLYSTGNEELDSLLEKAFCEGYELGQKEYAKKDKKDEDVDDEELSEDDLKAIKYYRKHQDKAETRSEAYKGNKRAQEKEGKKASRKLILGGAGLGASYGVIAGSLASNFESPSSTAKGAAVGAAVGAGLGVLAGKRVKKNWKNVDKKSKDAQVELNRELDKDRLDVAAKKMSKKDFIKKWGGNK